MVDGIVGWQAGKSQTKLYVAVVCFILTSGFFVSHECLVNQGD